jgi:hypothetical protein
MTRRLAAFATFWYEFIVGDDSLVAIGVVCALALTCVLHVTSEAPVWWVLPAAVLILLPASLWRMAHRQLPKPPTDVASARTVVSVPESRE